MTHDLWHLAGWTMVHYLWIGTLLAAAVFASRLLLRRAAPIVRYATALVCFALLAMTPIGIAAWLIVNANVLDRGSNHNTIPVESPATSDTVVDLATSDPIRHDSVQRSVITPPDAPPGEPASTAVEPLPGLQPLAVFTIQSVVPYLPWLWLIGTPLTFLLVAAGIVGTKRLRRASRPVQDGSIIQLCTRLASSLRITRRVTIAVCDRIAAPVLVGIVRPLILLPPAALTGWSPEEIEMVLLHELAHVRRWDNLVNLLQRLVESLLFFHPAVWLVSNWVRREREACCDAAVIARTQHPHAYAELLVALAAQMPRSVLFHPAASSAMAAGPLRSRIRRILQLDNDPMLISGKSFTVMLATLVTAATLAVVYLPTIGQAEEQTSSDAAVAEREETTGEKPDSVAKALDDYRKTIVTYDLDFDSGFPEHRWTTYDAKRLQRYPTRDAWPDVLGHVDTDPTKFRVVREPIEKAHEAVTGGNAYLTPLAWSIGTKGYATLLLLDGTKPNSHVVAHSYTSFACFGPLAGDVLFKSYATAVVDGDMSGQITSDSYFNLVVTGKFTGRIYTSSYAMIYLMGGFEGKVEMERSKVYIAGRTNKADLARITGPGKVCLEQSDLPAGEHKLGELLVMVKQSTTKSAKRDEPPQARSDTQRLTIATGDQQATAESQNGRLRLQMRETHGGSGKFPSLEDQKLADLAYRRLQLELEPINDEELKRVQALGYDGGLRITSAPSGIHHGGILVGLHVWPTKSLKDVGEVLNRSDLDELSPLKYYIVYPGAVSDPDNPGKHIPKDFIRTGRIPVNLDPRQRPAPAPSPRPASTLQSPQQPSGGTATLEPSEPHDRGPYSMPTPSTPRQYSPSQPPPLLALPGETSPPSIPQTGEEFDRMQQQRRALLAAEEAAAAAANDKSNLRYDGVTFEKWSQAWLSPSEDLKALAALIAFADAGFGEEAINAILFGAFSNSTGKAQKVRRFLNRLPAEDVPVVIASLLNVLENDLSPNRRVAAIRALAAMGPPAEPALETLKQRLASDYPGERIAAAAAIKMILGKDQYQKPIADVLGEELGITVVKTPSGAWGAVPRDGAADSGEAFGKFTDAVIQEQELLLPPSDQKPPR